jgi:hypothetical protein
MEITHVNQKEITLRSPEEVSRIAKAHILQRSSRSECCSRNKHSITIKCYGWDVLFLCLIGSMYLEGMRAVELSGQLCHGRNNTVLAQTDNQADSRQQFFRQTNILVSSVWCILVT